MHCRSKLGGLDTLRSFPEELAEKGDIHGLDLKWKTNNSFQRYLPYLRLIRVEVEIHGKDCHCSQEFYVCRINQNIST